MAKILFTQGVSTSAGTVAASTTNNYGIGQGSSISNIVESNVTIVHRSAGVYSNLYIRVIANDRGTSTWRVRKNSANGNQSVSVTASTTGEFEDLVNTDTVSAGDSLCTRITTGAGGTTFIFSTASILFAATTNTVERFNASPSNNTATFMSFGGRSGGNATEANSQMRLRTAGTVKNYALLISANTRDSNSTFRVRKNGANGNINIVVAAASTGTFEDTSNTDSVSISDLVNYSVVLDAGTGAITTRVNAIDLETTNGKFELMSGSVDTAITVSSTVTTYFPTGGTLELNSTVTESNQQNMANIAFTASFLGCYISANTIVGASTLAFRKNSANGNQAVSITSLTTGFFEDATHSDSIIASDEINYALTGGASGTSLTVRIINMLGSTQTARVKSVIMPKGVVPFNRP